jgi:hypothetical protein|tara:strand:- start:1202 stop:1486 length:285 start_codon:yes stop_codon:yes gene_type:complete
MKSFAKSAACKSGGDKTREVLVMEKKTNNNVKKYSVTLFDVKQRDGFKVERVQIAWRPDWQTSHALLFENPNHINLIPQLLEEAGYTKQKRSVF